MATLPEPTIVNDFTILVDNNEGLPYTFKAIRADADQDNQLLIVPTKKVSLWTGDYSIEGYETVVSVERKTLEDLFGTLTHGRTRFTDEMGRLNEMRYAAVVVEANLVDVYERPPEYSKARPKSIGRTVLSFTRRFPGVRWWWGGNRAFAQQITFQILNKFWEHRND